MCGRQHCIKYQVSNMESELVEKFKRAIMEALREIKKLK
jgi:hypothetical protein